MNDLPLTAPLTPHDRNGRLGRCRPLDGKPIGRAGEPARIYRLRAVAGTEARDRGRVRLCPRARRGVRLEAARLRALLFRAEGQRRGARRGVLARHRLPPRHQARGRDGDHLQRQADDLCRALEIPARRRAHRAGRHRRAAQAAGGTPPAADGRGAVRGRAQEEIAVSARGDRHRDLADRGGDPRHTAPARRPFPAARAAVAGRGAGRGRGGADRGGDRGVQPDRGRWSRCRGPIC